MFSRFFVSLFIICVCSTSVSAKNNDNPFAKTEVLNIGKEISWKIDKEDMLATKTAGDGKGVFYHLKFDNRQLELMISSDADGLSPKKFSQLEIINVIIDGRESLLFKWCLNNQQRHNRFLQQGLKVKKNICTVDGDAGNFIMRLNKDTLTSLQQGNRLLILLKPFRISLELYYDLGDFNDMYVGLNTKPAVETNVVVEKIKSVNTPAKKKCLLDAPVKYKNIQSVEYDCDNAIEKNDAVEQLNRLVNEEKARQKKLAAEKEKQRRLAEQRKQKELAEKLKREEQLKAEAAAIAASEEKQAAISNEITQKMVKVCEKYWNKGEHRCYCQKYIDKAPIEIQASSTCK